MKKNDEIMEQMTGNAIVTPLITFLAKNMDGFAEDLKGFREAIQALEKAQDGHTAPSVKDMTTGIDLQMEALVLFSGLLGLKANLEHYKDPIARTFLDVDCDIYLREDMAKRLPDCVRAQEARRQFSESLPDHQEAHYEMIAEYVSLLETTMPKLAHYYGYLLGNELFPRIVPGYYPDLNMTMQYKEWMQMYLGVPDLPTKCPLSPLFTEINA